jgi:hypothetical protein
MKKTFFVCAGVVLALGFSLAFTGCPQDPEPVDRLVGTWSNGKSGGLERKFTINSDFTFKTFLNPTCIDNGKENPGDIDPALNERNTLWQVVGKLAIMDDVNDLYTMSDLEEKNGVFYDPPTDTISVAGVLGMVKNARVEIKFNGDNEFTFASADTNEKIKEMVNKFFGDTYKRQ